MIIIGMLRPCEYIWRRVDHGSPRGNGCDERFYRIRRESRKSCQMFRPREDVLYLREQFRAYEQGEPSINDPSHRRMYPVWARGGLEKEHRVVNDRDAHADFAFLSRRTAVNCSR